jgi:hypothetical protein
MSKIIIDITQWPDGISLDIGTDSFQTSIAGPHGGGVGRTIKRFRVDADKLIAAIEKYRGEEE